MANRRGVPGGVIPSPTGGGLTGAVAGFAEMREMARRARMEEQQHQLEMQRFQAQLEESQMGQIATQFELLSNIAQPGQKLGELAPNLVDELAPTLGIDPEQLGESVLNPFGPEHVISMGVEEFVGSATPDDLARLGEIASSVTGKTLEQVRAEAKQGNFASLLTTVQTNWVRNNPDDFEAAIAQELGPDQMYDINVFGHDIELRGDSAAEILVRMQQVLDARTLGQGDMAAEQRSELIDWGRSIAEDLGLTGMVAPINEMVNLMTDPDLTPGEYIETVDNLKARSPEIRLLVEAMEGGRAVGTSALLNLYRDDPQVEPILNMMEFANQLEIFPADERVQILNSLGGVLDSMGLAHLKTGIVRSTRVRLPDVEEGEQTGGVPDIANRFGISEGQAEAALTRLEEIGFSREQAIQEMLTGDIGEMRPAVGDPQESPPQEQPSEPGVRNPEAIIREQPEPGRGTPSFAREMARRQLDDKQRQLSMIESRAADMRGGAQRSLQRRAEQLRADIARIQTILQEGGDG